MAVTHYLVGGRANAERPHSQLRVYTEPPLFLKPMGSEPERCIWRKSGVSFHPERGKLKEWRLDIYGEGNQLQIARVIPESALGELAGYDATIANLEAELKAARVNRLMFLEALAPRCTPVVVAKARAEREAFDAAKKVEKAETAEQQAGGSQ